MAHILIIEDDPDFSSSLELILGLRDVNVLAATSAENALQLLEERSAEVGLVFMDIKLPGMDGITCLQEIHSRWPEIICITMTGFRDNDRLDRARSAGATEILLKPFRMEKFIGLVEKYL